MDITHPPWQTGKIEAVLALDRVNANALTSGKLPFTDVQFLTEVLLDS